MQSRRGRIAIFCVLGLLGLILLVYGLRFHTANISPKQGQDAAKFAKSEPNLIKEVSIGGVKRDNSGKIKQTYTEKEEAPKACPT